MEYPGDRFCAFRVGAGAKKNDRPWMESGGPQAGDLEDFIFRFAGGKADQDVGTVAVRDRIHGHRRQRPGREYDP
jgi:hypothetical protein